MSNPIQPGFKRALELFHWTATTVPAYQDFLKRHQINHEKIQNPDDFKKVPYVDKNNYLRAYPFADLFPERKIPPMVSVSSGSSGEPFYWPRGEEQETEGGQIHNNIFRHIFGVSGKRTLVVICFSMGTWVAGTYTLASSRWASRQEGNITIVTPGIEKDDTLAILKNFALNFDRVIITGYPPFVMDIIHEARQQQIDLDRLNLRLLFAGENFSEVWRDTIHKLAGIKSSFYGSASIYGTADAAVLGHETPLSIFARKKTDKDSKLYSDLFGQAPFLPTLVQYYPGKKYFESTAGKVVFTCKAGLPLIRYNIHDKGQIISYHDIIATLEKHEVNDLTPNLKSWQLPFICLFGRDDIAASFYAVNIYPENIKVGLEDKRVNGYVTGKFVAETRLAENQLDQELIINLELTQKNKPGSEIVTLIQQCIYDNLIKLNAEFRKLSRSIGERQAKPTINLIEFGDPKFEIKKSKLKWIN